ncbi:hypothetical protein OU415_29870 [Saccharopolyspora sp. WRP15-2]|uniref:Uncharacterized protein n=1 Tax=Saccharopolyspora oryzae TaxID=2997343 RepID=A0ABT4V6S6_9PSEU|nr:hypothetical protein [Saccharopolyspora oryzae]MDA3629670.1 hypothetical protein [Saccharopolyspora oryzae]
MTYQQTAPPQAAPVSLKRPATLLAFVIAGAVSALSGIAAAIHMMAGGRTLAEQYATDLMNSDPASMGIDELLSVTGGESTGDAIETLKSMGFWEDVVTAASAELMLKSIVALIFVLPLLLFTLLAMKAATWARVLVTIFAVLSLLPHLILAIAVGLPIEQGLGFVGLATAVLAIVLAWLPANGRYAKARKFAA